VHTAYTQYRTAINHICVPLSFADPMHVIGHDQCWPIYEMAMRLFREHVVMHDDFMLIHTLLTLVEKERRREVVINRSTFFETCAMLSELGIYESEFERPLLAQTLDFYRVCVRWSY
jgi:hypothetical protein